MKILSRGLSRFCFFVLLFVSCTSTPPNVDYLDPDTYDHSQSKYHSHVFVTNIKLEELKLVAEAVFCSLDDSQFPVVLMLNRDSQAISVEDFCGGWLAQSALSSGFQVLAVNRMGYGKTSGPIALGSPIEQELVEAAIEQARHRQWMKASEPSVIWGYGSAVILATQMARQYYPKSTLLWGGGVYDTERLMRFEKADERTLQEILMRLVAIEGEEAHQNRSIAWNLEGLPAKIIIYHGQKDKVMPFDRAQAVRGALKNFKYQVDFYAVPDSGHQIPMPQHRALLQQIFKTLKI